MKLDNAQINTIETILEKSGVVYIDYKFEILDHIATEVENLMEETSESFEQILPIIVSKWNPKFKKSSSPFFGIIWVIPEILIRNAKKMYWQKMIKLLLAPTLFTLILNYFKHYFIGKTDLVFYIICSLLGVQLLGYIAIRFTSHKTTFGFLYKQQFLGLLGLYFIGLFNLCSNQQIFERTTDNFSPIFFIIALLALAPVANFNYLKEHFSQLNRNRKFI
jgi:hypothetical protein